MTARPRGPHPGFRLTMVKGTFIQQHLADSHSLAPGLDPKAQGQNAIHQLPAGAALPMRGKGTGRGRMKRQEGRGQKGELGWQQGEAQRPETEQQGETRGAGKEAAQASTHR